ncbi:MAG: 50S ribosomal protein L25 [Chlamydiae bacterium]|nr:50S ribosomal protein L25 [Chlamydiota bacterium]
MKLNIIERSKEKKRESNRIRRSGDIPAVLYGRGIESETVTVKGEEFAATLRAIPKGRLSTTVFTLVGKAGKERRAIVKDIQYHSTTYNILHLDFEILEKDVRVNVKIPIECTGVLDCIGIKLGGVLRRVIRYIQVNCLPDDIPTVFEVDVKDLGVRQYRKLKDLAIPENVRPLANLEEVAVVIAMR